MCPCMVIGNIAFCDPHLYYEVFGSVALFDTQ